MSLEISSQGPALIDENADPPFRDVFGGLLAHSTLVETAIYRIRLGAVDLSAKELRRLRTFRVLVAEVSSRTAEAEVYAMSMDPHKRQNLVRILRLLKSGVMEIRAAPLGGWSPDFSVFSHEGAPHNVLIGLHWFHRPFPHRGPAWAGIFGSEEASRARVRFQDLWDQAHDIGATVRRMMETTSSRAVQTGTPGPRSANR